MPKSYDPDEKIKIVLRAIKGEKISDLVDEYDVSRSSIYLWKNEFLDGGMSKLSGDSVTEQESKLKEKDEQIKEIEKKEFSTITIVLIIILILRFMFNFSTEMFNFVIAIIYLIPLIGIFMKQKWGLSLVMIIAIIDSLFLFIISGPESFGAGVGNFILFFLAYKEFKK